MLEFQSASTDCCDLGAGRKTQRSIIRAKKILLPEQVAFTNFSASPDLIPLGDHSGAAIFGRIGK